MADEKLTPPQFLLFESESEAERVAEVVAAKPPAFYDRARKIVPLTCSNASFIAVEGGARWERALKIGG